MEISLRDFRCQACGKLLCKGMLRHPKSVLELKCRGCGRINTFSGLEAGGADPKNLSLLKKNSN